MCFFVSPVYLVMTPPKQSSLCGKTPPTPVGGFNIPRGEETSWEGSSLPPQFRVLSREFFRKATNFFPETPPGGRKLKLSFYPFPPLWGRPYPGLFKSGKPFYPPGRPRLEPRGSKPGLRFKTPGPKNWGKFLNTPLSQEPFYRNQAPSPPNGFFLKWKGPHILVRAKLPFNQFC